MYVQTSGRSRSRICGDNRVSMEFYRQTYAEIDLDAFQKNIESIRARFADAEFFCPMIKANGYGHGDQTLSLFLQHLGVQAVGVCLIEEALLLKEAGFNNKILIFRGFDEMGAKEILGQGFVPVISSFDHIAHLQKWAKTEVEVHVKFNTGMNRLGFAPSEATNVVAKLAASPKLKVEGLLTHLLNGDDGIEDEGETARQLFQFNEISKVFSTFKPKHHVYNSGGCLAKEWARQLKLKHKHFDNRWGIRPGLMIYGYKPVGMGTDWDLHPVMNLKSTVSHIRQVSKGEGVSYGASWRASRDSQIGIVPIGYADGYHRMLSNRASVLVLGERVPVVGRICMDFMMIDLTDTLKSKTLQTHQDREVTLFGFDRERNFLSVDEIAHHSQTISWEVLTQVGVRVPRRYLGGKSFFNEVVGTRGRDLT